MGKERNGITKGGGMEAYRAKYVLSDIITINDKMIELKEFAHKVSDTNSPVIVYGETGTGKELFVQAIHNTGKRREGPFIAQNCAAMPSELLEGILFGTVKGAFTGAEDRAGLLELGDGGTIYLDELNSMSIELQAKLLRVIQDGFVRRVGASYENYYDMRIIASVNIEPERCIAEGFLRKDLYYRLNVLELRVPELRNRRDDIAVLAEHFINKYNLSFGKDIKGITSISMQYMLNYEWPGNVRELKHFIESVLTLKGNGYISEEDLPENIREIHRKSFHESMDTYERKLLSEAIRICQGNISKTAEYLMLPRQTLQYKLKKHEIGDVPINNRSML